MLSLTGLLSQAASIGGRAPSVVDEDTALSWSELESRSKLSAGMLLEIGLKPGERVALLMQNSVRFLELMFAIVRAGGIIVPVNTRFAEPEILDCLRDCGAEIFVVDHTFLEVLDLQKIKSTNVNHVICCGEKSQLVSEANSVLFYDEIFACAGEVSDAGRCGDDVAAIFYTSGTTGQPKGVTLTHAGIVVNELQWIASLGLTQRESLLVIAPMFHAAGALNAIGTTALGCEVVFMRTFDLDALLATIEKQRITKIGLIVVMLEMIGRHPNLSDYDLSCVEKITYGGSPISETTLEMAQNIFPNAQLFQVYGQTEGGPTVSILPPEYHVADSDKIRSAGIPVIGTQIQIVDEVSIPLPVREIGEILVAGPGVSPGYWNLEQETERSRRGKWLKTGDAGFMDEDGFLHICDRIKDMIISGGENVYPSEIENALMKREEILECAVIGIPSDKWGEQAHAIIRFKEGKKCDEASIIKHCRRLLAGYKVPKSMEFRVEPLPISPSAKILKSKLREPFWQKKDRNI